MASTPRGRRVRRGTRGRLDRGHGCLVAGVPGHRQRVADAGRTDHCPGVGVEIGMIGPRRPPTWLILRRPRPDRSRPVDGPAGRSTLVPGSVPASVRCRVGIGVRSVSPEPRLRHQRQHQHPATMGPARIVLTPFRRPNPCIDSHLDGAAPFLRRANTARGCGRAAVWSRPEEEVVVSADLRGIAAGCHLRGRGDVADVNLGFIAATQVAGGVLAAVLWHPTTDERCNHVAQ